MMDYGFEATDCLWAGNFYIGNTLDESDCTVP